MSKPTAKPVLMSRKKSPKKLTRKKTKPSTVNRYAERKAKRDAWLAKNPGMVAGALGVQAHPAPITKIEVADSQTGRLSSEHVNISNTPKSLDEGRNLTLVEIEESSKAMEIPTKMKLVAMDVTDQIGDRLDTSRDHLTPGDPGFDEPQGAA